MSGASVCRMDQCSEGRWTIWASATCDRDCILKCADAVLSLSATPVVPCDDAAVERAGAVLNRMFGWTDTYAQHIAETVLRAAGETP